MKNGVKWSGFSIRLAAASIVSLAMCGMAHASYWFRVADASQIKWLLGSDGLVYLRNLDSFDSSVLGCCYNYQINTNTAGGRAQWATLMAKIEAREPVWIAVVSQTSAGGIDFVADF